MIFSTNNLMLFFPFECFVLRCLWTVWTPFSICRHFQFFLLSILIFFNIELTSISPVCIVHIESVPSTHMCAPCVCKPIHTSRSSTNEYDFNRPIYIRRLLHRISLSVRCTCACGSSSNSVFLLCTGVWQSSMKQNAHKQTSKRTHRNPPTQFGAV